jgi:hypothetical protein
MVQEPGSNLPAPYVNPWSLLLRDLKAVGASLGLSLREVFRRNREGTLPRPPFWPEALRSLFWPLLVVLVLALPSALVLVLSKAGSGAVPGQPDLGRPVGSEAIAVASPDPAPISSPQPAAPSTAAPPLAMPPAPPGRAAAPAPAVTRAQVLLAELMRPEADGLLLAVEEDAGRLCLVLRLDPSFRHQSAARQERLAALWQEQAQTLGYEQLELQDPAGHLFGRSASVGSGMILFTMAAGG